MKKIFYIIYNEVNLNIKEKIDMCQANRDYGKENLNKGKSIGRTEGINIGRNEGIIQTLISNYSNQS